MAEVLLLGDLNVDVLLQVPDDPLPGGETLASQAVIRVGGSAANTAIALSRLGVSAALVACVGDDALAETALQELEEAGVNTSLIQRDASRPTGLVCVAVTPGGERTMFGHRGANVSLSPERVVELAWDDVRLLHLSAYAFIQSPQQDAAWQALQAAHAREAIVSMDCAPGAMESACDQVMRACALTDILCLDEKQVRAICGDPGTERALRSLLDLGPSWVAIKRGAAGSLVGDAARVHEVPAFGVQVVDTTGAGDAYLAGLLLGRLRGLSLPAAGTLASALGALATTRWGAGLPSSAADDLRSLLEAARAGEGGAARRRLIESALETLPGSGGTAGCKG